MKSIQEAHLFQMIKHLVFVRKGRGVYTITLKTENEQEITAVEAVLQTLFADVARCSFNLFLCTKPLF